MVSRSDPLSPQPLRSPRRDESDHSYEPSRASGRSLAMAPAAFAGLVVAGWVIGRSITRSTAIGPPGVDRSILRFMMDHEVASLTGAMRVLTYLGSSLLLVPVIVTTALAWRLWRKDWSAARLLGAVYLGAALVFDTVKRLVGRSRPPDELHLAGAGGFAFPSGHATQAAAVWGTLAFLGCRVVPSRRGRIVVWLVAVCIAALVGLTRMYLRVHWFTDVVAGWTAGGVWAGVVLATWGTAADRGPADGSASAQGPERMLDP